MATILVVAEAAKGALKKATFHALGAAQKLAERTEAQVHAVVIGQGVAEAAGKIANATVHVVDGPAFANPLAETHAAAAVAAAKAAGASQVSIDATSYGSDSRP